MERATLIRTFNRMNDLIPSASVSGTINYQGVDLYDKDVDPNASEEKDRYGVSEAKSFS